MLNFFVLIKNSLRAKPILNSRKIKQTNQSSDVKSNISNVKKNGDKAVINYEKKFSKIKTNTNKIKFSKGK